METKCAVCGRRLKNPKYVALGVGPMCAKRVGLRAFAKDETLPYVALRFVHDTEFMDASRFRTSEDRDQYSLTTLGFDPAVNPDRMRDVIQELRVKQSFRNYQGVRVAWVDMRSSSR